ncbi:CAP domain-containing protein [Janthinobacterium sp. GMG1]|uniref:CAP domain-containing protein n=1 Tax=Janthinobacterium sp. GMG1 TaxID=3096007 RepID=UPI002ACA2BA8|nr:CAP domain-containing protein [Janthinobacterium sp. GMG1]MDZ5636655.1 CAP domain-containing protein [Janthinobacterium sp. GMG1]
MIASSLRWKYWIPALLSAALLSACGGGDSGGKTSLSTSTQAGQLTQEPGAPVVSNNIATDGFNWINYRRSQIGLAPLVRNSLIDNAALGHSNYLNSNNVVVHNQVKGKPGFTGETLYDRLTASNYGVTSVWGEVIAGVATNSGFYMAENLITAVYHRFLIFEPIFKEGGAGAAVNNSGYAYFTTDLAGNSRYGPGLPAGQIVSYPFNGQTKVATSFSSNEEEPDPVPNQDVVGYPISVHANFDATLSVTTFTVRQRGAATDLTVRLLSKETDAINTSRSVAAIIPLAPLLAATTYDVSFIGKVNGANVTRSWSFTTR